MNGKLTLAVAALLSTLMAGGLHAQASVSKHDSTMKSNAGATASASKQTMAHHAAWSKAQIKEAQEGLKKAGFYKGDTTGVFNADTRKALKAYQKSNKLPVTGRLSDDVLAKLKSS
ncbi:MAG TPA: peptidoglycan-binding domain-containing protein [Gemmatimonadales bacterium]